VEDVGVVASGRADEATDIDTSEGRRRRVVNGCEPFTVYAQNRWQPPGARLLMAPNHKSRPIREYGFAPNQLITVDGWVHGSRPYPHNPEPWNSNIWYHVFGGGWVAFAAVRELPTSQDPTLRAADGGAPAPTPESCHGAVDG